jgi:SRSO17 transposase
MFGAAMTAIAGCFARREARATATELIKGLLLELDTRNCWTLAQALGHSGPHRLQHLLSRASFDHDRAREEITRLVIRELSGQDVVLLVDETGDAKSSTDCVGAGAQYSGAIGGVGLCQVSVHLAAVTPTTRIIIDRALYLPADWAGDEERRELTGVPQETVFATKPQQALAMVADALTAGIEARWFAADEVYGGRELRTGIRSLGLGYTVAVPSTYRLTDGSGHRWEARKLINKVRPPAVDAPGDRPRHQGHSRVRLGLDRCPPRRRHRRGRGRNERAGRPPSPLHQRGVLLPLLRPRRRGPGSPGRCDLPQMEDRGDLSTRQEFHRT